MSLRKACKEADVTEASRVLELCKVDESFAAQYARARETGYQMLADELIDISNTPKAGVKTKTNEKGETETTEGDMIEHRRLQVDTRKWMLSKMLPKIYGDRLDLNHSGTVSTQNLTRAELMAIAAQGKTQGGDAAETQGEGSE
jgi:hypothetical protein